jgi:flagellar protein FliS
MGADGAHRDYVESRILSAHPVEIVQMLYQLALDSLRAAITHLKEGNAMARAEAVSKAEAAVNELTAALDHTAGAPFSRTLAELYAYVQEQIIKGHTQRSEEAFREAYSILKTLSEGWSGVKADVCGSDTGSPAEGSDQSNAYSSDPPGSVTSRDWSG